MSASRTTLEAGDFVNRHPDGCGIVGVYQHPHAARAAYLGLHALQHRGQESAGMAVFSGHTMRLHKAAGLVDDVFKETTLDGLRGQVALGHVRYSTAGGSSSFNAQPLMALYRGGHIAVAHNGNLTNAAELADALEAEGAVFQSTTDSELLIHLLARHATEDFETALLSSLTAMQGAYSMALLRDGDLWAFRDPRGFRPLCLGRLDEGWVVASESCALDVMGAAYVREIEPGEVVSFRHGRMETRRNPITAATAFCAFELIYYSRPDSVVAGAGIYAYRRRLGAELARERPVEADVVVPVPDSSNAAAVGYAEASGLPLEMGLVRSHYVGRTFIEPRPHVRDLVARLKYNAVREVVAGKRVVIVDDSIVRGTTVRTILRTVRAAGAREIHLRISSPPWRYPCHYGIDTPDDQTLIANRMSESELRETLGVDSLGFSSISTLVRALPQELRYCTTCFTGKYPEETAGLGGPRPWTWVHDSIV